MNELNLSLTIAYGKTPNSLILTPTLAITVAGLHYIHDQVALSTGDLILNKGLVGTIGFVFVKNNDLVNNCLVGTDGVTYPTTLLPGIWTYFTSWATANVHAKSSAGTPNLEYAIVEA